MYFSYLFFKYLKKFLVVWFSLAGIFVLFTVLFNFSKLPQAGNLQVLYVFYSYLYSLDITFSLSLFFAFLYTIYEMIKFNELINFYSFGFSKLKLFKPFATLMFLFSIVLILLNFTQFAYSNLKAQAILDKSSFSTSNLFLKFNDRVVFIQQLNTLAKEAYGVKVFFLKDLKVVKVVSAKKLKFYKNKWIGNAQITSINSNFIKKEEKEVKILKNFKPRVISTLKTLNAVSFYDAYLSVIYFKNVDKNSILSIVFFKTFSIVIMILLNYVVFNISPIHLRTSNVSLFMIKSIFSVLFIWGGMLILYKFAKQGILPFWTLSLPSILVFIYILIKQRRFNEL